MDTRSAFSDLLREIKRSSTLADCLREFETQRAAMAAAFGGFDSLRVAAIDRTLQSATESLLRTVAVAPMLPRLFHAPRWDSMSAHSALHCRIDESVKTLTGRSAITEALAATDEIRRRMAEECSLGESLRPPRYEAAFNLSHDLMLSSTLIEIPVRDDCQTLRAEIAALREEVRALRAELASSVPADDSNGDDGCPSPGQYL